MFGIYNWLFSKTNNTILNVGDHFMKKHPLNNMFYYFTKFEIMIFIFMK